MNLLNLEGKTASEATSFPEIRKWIEIKGKTKTFNLKESPLNKTSSVSSLRANTEMTGNKHYSPEHKKRSPLKLNDEMIKPLFKVNFTQINANSYIIIYFNR